MHNHIVQTSYWAKFKESFGTTVVNAGGVYYTKHKVPFTNMFFAYCPRPNPFEIDFSEIKTSLKKNNCIGIKFDVPNVVVGSDEEKPALDILQKHCVKSPRDEFAKGNVLLDLTPSEEQLLERMHTKQRYNIRLAEKKGLVCKEYSNEEGLEKFYQLYKGTGQRQGYYFRPKSYFESLWNVFGKEGIAHILVVEQDNIPMASWILFVLDDVLYYPYGGSDDKYKPLQASSLIGWGAIKLGKKYDCKLFDMWGASVDPEDTKDSYYGFTNFKIRFGGKHVKYLDSYDLVVNPVAYNLFNVANNVRWKLLDLLR